MCLRRRTLRTTRRESTGRTRNRQRPIQARGPQVRHLRWSTRIHRTDCRAAHSSVSPVTRRVVGVIVADGGTLSVSRTRHAVEGSEPWLVVAFSGVGATDAVHAPPEYVSTSGKTLLTESNNLAD